MTLNVPHETRWQGGRSLFTGVVHGDGSAHCGLEDLAANTATARFPERCLISSKMSTGAELFVLFMFLRIARAPAQYVTDSSFVEQGVN